MEMLKTALVDLQCELVAERNLVNPNNITWLQYDILYQLNKQKRILPSDLNIILGTSRTKLSKALRDLKSLGYVQQFPNELDGRELFTTITLSGKELLNNITKKHNVLYKTAIQVLTKEEQIAFEKISIKFSKALKDERINNYE